MLAILFEQPWFIGAIGTVLTIVTFYGWAQTGNTIALQSNQYDKVLSRISPDHSERVARVSERMKTVKFSVASPGSPTRFLKYF